MACMEHICGECDHVWFDNEPRGSCPVCGNFINNAHIFDELPDEE